MFNVVHRVSSEKSVTLYGKTYVWDEDAEAETYNIRSRSLCVKHNWVNASLYFAPPSGFPTISLEAEVLPNFHPAWGSGYGGIRFCSTCKAIDCIHQWEDPDPEDQTWRQCKHEIVFKGLQRRECSKCGAFYQWEYGGHPGPNDIAAMNKRFMESTEWFAPYQPTIQRCKICGLRIKRQ